MKFPYRRYPSPQVLPSLAGFSYRPRPVVDVGVVGPTGARVTDALLDTGADDTVFPDRLASTLGIDLHAAPSRSLGGLTGLPTVVRYALVRLRLSDGVESREWPAWIGFTNAPLAIPALGFAGCLQFFTAVFHGDQEEVELTVNGSYPGT